MLLPPALWSVLAFVSLALAPAGPPFVLCPPVAAPVAAGFAAPPCEWCPGRRGLTYATEPGAPVRAIGRGEVSFAGLVAGRAWVTVTHPDGHRSSVGPLASIDVEAGMPVELGRRLGSASGPLHLGLRIGPDYVDPAPLLTCRNLRPRLVPLRPGDG